MPFIRIEGIKGQVFIPDDEINAIKKNPCKDCYFCQFCNDEKCSTCLKNRCCKKNGKPDINKKESDK